MWRCVLMLAIGCGASPPPVKPAPPPACWPIGAQEQPLITQWSADQRAALATAMRHGLVAVSYTCAGLRVIPNCSAPGHYGFIATPPVPLAVRLETADEAAANLPGATHPIDVTATVAGRWTTFHKRLAHEDLDGRCEGVSHFVEAVDTGATGARGCAGTTTADATPRAGCDTALRLHLTALDSDAGAADAAIPTTPCGAGRVWRDHKCTLPSPAHPHQCHFDDYAACDEQCHRGHAGSCTTLAMMIAAGRGVAKDEARAIELLAQACRDGEPMACRHTADVLATGETVARDAKRAIEMFGALCDGGLGTACSYLGALAEAGTEMPADHARSLALFKRACDAGYARGCNNLASRYATEPAGFGNAIAIYNEACATGDIPACNNLAAILAAAPTAVPDLHHALKILELGCAQQQVELCADLGILLARGIGIAKDEARGARLLGDACAAGNANACQVLGKH